LLAIDTACQALRIAAGAIDCRGGAASLPGRFHITRCSRAGNAAHQKRAWFARRETSPSAATEQRRSAAVAGDAKRW
jgi:hypothetical protein